MTDHKAERRFADELAQEIRRVDGNHSLGAGALAEALKPFMFSKYVEWANLGQMPAAAPAASEGEDGAVFQMREAGAGRGWEDIDRERYEFQHTSPAHLQRYEYRALHTRPAAQASEGEDGAVGEIFERRLSDYPYRELSVDWTDDVPPLGTKLYTRPAAQVAATPKHDEGRELLPCPFCGCPDVDVGHQGDSPRHHFVNCVDCLASTNVLAPSSGTEANAIDAWNRRSDALPIQPAGVPKPGSLVWNLSTRIGDLTAENTRLRALATRPAARRVADDPRIAELIAAAEGAEALIGVMFGSVHGRYPETIDTPLGIPVKVGKIAASLRAALESFAQPDEGVSGG